VGCIFSPGCCKIHASLVVGRGGLERLKTDPIHNIIFRKNTGRGVRPSLFSDMKNAVFIYFSLIRRVINHMNTDRKIPDVYGRIWAAVQKIPRGRVSTYGTVAGLAGLPGQARLVGYAMFNLPEGAGVPWHRVVNAGGRISLPPGRESRRRQRLLLEREGIIFTGDKIDLKAVGWPPSSFRR
jgi:methylated-DNA-protein-cysteine methyltransferase-like protein